MRKWLWLLAPVAWGQISFEAKVYPVLEAAQCRVCHTRAGVASGTRLHFPEKGADAGTVRRFGLELRALVNAQAPGSSLLLTKPTNRVSHTGGERIAAGSDAARILGEWVNYLARLRDVDASGLVAPSVAKAAVRRLTHSQYDNTIRDLLGDPSRPARRFPPEDFVDGFKNQTRGQRLSPLLVESYSAAAEKLALNAFRGGDLNGLIPCRPKNDRDANCRDAFIRGFGLRAFRRPLNMPEVARYTAVFMAQKSFTEGARVVVEAMLQSPKFLFLDARANDYAVASRLSYLLWDTMPDEALLAAAGRGELRTAAGRERMARRMLDDPRATQAMDEFFGQWLRFDRVLHASKEERRFPEYSPELASAMVEETRLLLQHLVKTNGNFLELLTADYGFLHSELATLYGMPAPAAQFALVKFPADARRAGLLGHASFLAATAGPTETSPTARGIFIREQLLCQHVPPPPPNVNTALPEPTEDKPLTRRQRLAAHVESPACASCHKLMDPIGFGLEHFDALGKWREKEVIQAGKTEFAFPLETNGEIAGLAGSAFSDARQLGKILAGSRVCQECIARQVFRYAYGRPEMDADEAVIARLAMAFRESGFRFRELLLAVVRGPEFAGNLDDNVERRSP